MLARTIQLILVGHWIFLCQVPLFAQNPTKILPFQYLKTGPGQDLNCIYTIAQDKQGFMWFGTLYGLVRYDGHDFKNYSEDNGSGLRDRRINDLEVDGFGNLWLVSARRLQVYSSVRDTIYQMTDLDGDSLIQYSNSRPNPIMVQDEEGMIWMLSRDGLFCIEPKKNPFQSIIRRFRFDINSNAEGDNLVQVILQDSQHNLWIGGRRGLYRFDRNTEKFEFCSTGIKASVIALCETEEGKIAIGTEKRGFQLYDPENQSAVIYSHEPTKPHSLAGESVYQIVKDGKNNIWLLVGSFENRQFSLQRFDPVSGRFQTYIHDQKVSGGMANMGGIGFYLFKDSWGQLWIVRDKGMQLFDPYKELMYNLQEREAQAIDWSAVHDFYEDNTGVIWIGTIATGLIKYAPSTHKFDVFIPEIEEGDPPSVNFLSLVYEDKGGNVWSNVGLNTYRYVFNKQKDLQLAAKYPFRSGSFLEDKNGLLWIGSVPQIKYFDPSRGQFLPNPNVSDLEIRGGKTLQDDEDWIWTATFGRGLIRFHPQTGEVNKFLHDPSDTNSVSSNFLSGVMVQDSERFIWAGGQNGLKKFDPRTGKFSSYLKGVTVDEIHWDGDSCLWLSTPGWGLYRLNRINGEFKKYSKGQGFPTVRPIRILEDERGDLWISSDVGLIHFEPESENWHVYDVDDGLPTSVFAYGAHKRKNGEMLFVSWGGDLVRFHPDSIEKDSFRPRVVFTDFKLFNQPVAIGNDNSSLKSSIWTSRELRLKSNHNVITLDFAALHYASPASNQFAYFMEGLDKEWNQIGNQQTVNFAGLPAGSYTFKVKAANHDGLWGEETALKITISPPWWATWWAYSLYALGLIFFLRIVYSIQKRRLQMRNQLKMEHQEAERLKELDTIKTRLYTNITHEFRTPLTIILGMAGQIRKSPQKWMEEGLQLIERNGKNLLQLVNQMLDLSKLESGITPVNLTEGDIIAYLKYVFESFHSLAKKHSITLHFQPDFEKLILTYDAEKLREIISNLISNAIKFTRQEGQVTLIVEKREEVLILKIRDTGIGISPEKLPYIFNRFYQVNDALTQEAKGTGIGLALTRELVKILKGEINVQSEPGKGTEFTVRLPMTSLPAAKSLPFSSGEMPGSQATLLIVEDNADLISFLQSLLEKDYHIVQASNGQQGLSKAVALIPDIIITDLMMPLMDGLELCNRLKTDIRTSHIPLIMLTAKADQRSKIKGLEKGADAYLRKPFDEKELRVRLQTLIASRKRLHKRYSGQLVPVQKDDKLHLEDTFMQKVRQILEAHLDDEEFGIPKICEELGMSRAQLYRKFNALTNQPIGHYFRSLRLHKAKELLLGTNLRIAEIAYRVGFKEPSYFTRTFKEEFGLNPSEIRQN